MTDLLRYAVHYRDPGGSNIPALPLTDLEIDALREDLLGSRCFGDCCEGKETVAGLLAAYDAARATCPADPT